MRPLFIDWVLNVFMRAYARAPVCVFLRVCACADALNVTSQWFFGLIRLLLAAWVHCIVKGTVNPRRRRRRGGLDLLIKNLPIGQTSGVSTTIFFFFCTLYILRYRVLLFLVIYSITLSLWFTLTLREGRNGGQHVPGRRYVYQWGSFIRQTFSVSHPLGVVWRHCRKFVSNSEPRHCFAYRDAFS